VRFAAVAVNGEHKGMLLLIDAARGAYQTALSEGLALAHIAEQSGRPQYWFANSILQVVTVTGCTPDGGTSEVLTRALLSELKLADDMLSVVDPADGQTKFDMLSLAKKEYDRYLAWARTVY
jgi:hypothetical protein